MKEFNEYLAILAKLVEPLTEAQLRCLLKPENQYRVARLLHAIVAKESVDMLRSPVTQLNLRVGTKKALLRGGIENVAQLVSKKETDLLKLTHFGRKDLQEVRDLLSGMGFKLGSPLNPDEIIQEAISSILH